MTGAIRGAAERVDLAGLVAALAAAQGPGRRLVGVAGPPGSGKSAFAERLRDALPAAMGAALLAMDGFHYDDRVLEARGHRARKGAPHTFDVDGFAAMLARLRRDDGRDVAVPVFDRAIEIARAGAGIVPAAARVVIVEGNYLLLDDPDWAQLRASLDATVFLRVPDEVIAARLAARWEGYGLDAAAIRAKLEDNDLPNARLVAARSVPADFEVVNA